MVHIVGVSEIVVSSAKEYASTITPSPDLKHLLMSVSDRNYRTTRYAVYELDSDRWIELDPAAGVAEWAGPRTIARIGERTLAFESLDSPGRLLYAFR